ncbi:hypothetical protein GOP47_0009706 [Adiantum capillus-veneris]|uniref:GDSL esterase/lipase n=1 Tax=Adiantum capillus-veneris TaxID=13818 RepID=A0A9D4UWR8_ADICA|nr:hypothetical protein GOP47_0009706 [Adiantum capillus-veneris]
MGFQLFCLRVAGFLVVLVQLWAQCSHAQPVVPAVFVFGDSTVDVGNNNYLETILKANFLPYGRDFDTKKPTGRFSDGRIATDYTISLLGFDSFPLPYLEIRSTGVNLTIGANFASGGSGFYDSTAQHFNVLTMNQQLELFKEYKNKLAAEVGSTNATSIVSDALYVVSAGNSDFLQNYYINLRLRRLYTPTQFSQIVLNLQTKFIQNLYSLGARRIGVVSVAPFGCVPLQLTVSRQATGCVESLNQVASSYNQALNNTIGHLGASLSGLKIAYFDIYNGLLDIIKNPAANGFKEARKACCGTGRVETAILCNQYLPGTCTNASEFVFFDSVHPSQAASQLLSNNLLAAGIALVS